MDFEKGELYHIYNQGNNRQKIFLNRDNYLFFLSKMRKHLLPFCDIVAYCLMPNHFHWMVKVNEVVMEPIGSDIQKIKHTELHSKHTHRLTPSHPVSKPSRHTLNNSIAILLRSYTRAINNQENRTGALFRGGTKAECLTNPADLSPSFINNTTSTIGIGGVDEINYPLQCFSYIHQNPVRAGLVKSGEDWEFSSAPDFAGIRDGTLIDRKIIEIFY